MKLRNGMGAALLVLSLCAFLAIPVLAGNIGVVEITWLTAAGRPDTYNEKLGWFTLRDYDTSRYSAIGLATGEQVEYDYVGPFFDGMARVMRYNTDGSGAPIIVTAIALAIFAAAAALAAKLVLKKKLPASMR